MNQIAQPDLWALYVRRWSAERNFWAKEFYQGIISEFCEELYTPSGRADAFDYFRSECFEGHCEALGINADAWRKELVDHGPNVTMGDISK